MVITYIGNRYNKALTVERQVAFSFIMRLTAKNQLAVMIKQEKSGS